jgi:hypothetical protein
MEVEFLTKIKIYNRFVTGRRRKLLKEMETDSVYGRLIDRGPIDKIIFKDGDLDQGIAHEYGHGISTRLVEAETD